MTVTADTLGHYTVSGSEESEKLAQVEKDYAAVETRISALAAQLEDASPEQVSKINTEITNEYIAYYRDRVRYVMTNSKSLTVVPVFYQVLGESLPVFGQLTDGIHISNVCDSLETVYPDSKYIRVLRKEAQARKDQMELNARIGAADEIGFPDIVLPDAKGQKVRLSDVDAKVILLQFWTASQAAASKLIKLQIANNTIEISAQDNDYNMSGVESTACQYEGDPISIGFKAPYVLELLNNIGTENTLLELSDPTRPGLFLPYEAESQNGDLLMLLMPMMI